jgi:hypothetical protein
LLAVGVELAVRRRSGRHAATRIRRPWRRFD